MQKLKPQWWPESRDLLWETHESGTRVRQLTSAPGITHDLYCEQPYCSPSGRRLALFRTASANPYLPGELLVYDIPTYRITSIASDVSGIGAGIMAVANAAWSGMIFAAAGQGSARRLLRIDLESLEFEELFLWSAIPGCGLLTVSADNKYGLATARTGTRNDEGRPHFGIYRVDLQTGDHELIHQNVDMCNPHLQYRLHTAARIMVQENRGCVVDEEGNVVRPCDERGAGLYSIAAGGTDRRDYPVGPPHTASSTGHECWIGDTDNVLITLHATHDDGTRCGNVLEVSHAWGKPRVVFDSEYIWNHISASRCGRYFVTDTYQQPGVPLLIGSIATGRTRVLCDSLTTGGAAQYSHAHPYLTADNKYVVFNSDRTGLPQVYIASVPDEFLRSLDA